MKTMKKKEFSKGSKGSARSHKRLSYQQIKNTLNYLRLDNDIGSVMLVKNDFSDNLLKKNARIPDIGKISITGNSNFERIYYSMTGTNLTKDIRLWFNTKEILYISRLTKVLEYYGDLHQRIFDFLAISALHVINEVFPSESDFEIPIPEIAFLKIKSVTIMQKSLDPKCLILKIKIPIPKEHVFFHLYGSKKRVKYFNYQVESKFLDKLKKKLHFTGLWAPNYKTKEPVVNDKDFLNIYLLYDFELLFDRLVNNVNKLHPYKVPEIFSSLYRLNPEKTSSFKKGFVSALAKKEIRARAFLEQLSGDVDCFIKDHHSGQNPIPLNLGNIPANSIAAYNDFFKKMLKLAMQDENLNASKISDTFQIDQAVLEQEDCSDFVSYSLEDLTVGVLKDMDAKEIKQLFSTNREIRNKINGMHTNEEVQTFFRENPLTLEMVQSLNTVQIQGLLDRDPEFLDKLYALQKVKERKLWGKQKVNKAQHFYELNEYQDDVWELEDVLYQDDQDDIKELKDESCSSSSFTANKNMGAYSELVDTESSKPSSKMEEVFSDPSFWYKVGLASRRLADDVLIPLNLEEGKSELPLTNFMQGLTYPHLKIHYVTQNVNTTLPIREGLHGLIGDIQPGPVIPLSPKTTWLPESPRNFPSMLPPSPPGGILIPESPRNFPSMPPPSPPGGILIPESPRNFYRSPASPTRNFTSTPTTPLTPVSPKPSVGI